MTGYESFLPEGADLPINIKYTKDSTLLVDINNPTSLLMATVDGAHCIKHITEAGRIAEVHIKQEAWNILSLLYNEETTDE